MTPPLRVRYRTLTQLRGGGYRTVTRTAAGPFYHGGRPRLRAGALIRTGQRTNSWGSRRGRSVEVFFTTDYQVAADTAAWCARETGRGYVYEVEPTGPIAPDSDPSSFKSAAPLRVIRMVAQA